MERYLEVLHLAVDDSEDYLIHFLKESQTCHAGLNVFKSQLASAIEPDTNTFSFIPDPEDLPTGAL